MVVRSAHGGAAIAVIAVVAILALAGCSTGGPPHGPTGTGANAAGTDTVVGSRDLAAIRALLHTRALAVDRDDRGAFLATVDTSDPRLVAQQRVLFANLRALPITRFGYDVGDFDVPVASIGKGRQASPQVLEQLQLAGAFSQTMSTPLADVFVRRDGRWVLGADATAKQTDPDIPVSRPWGGDPIRVGTAGHVVAVTDRDGGISAERLAVQARADAARVAGTLRMRARDRVLIDATTSGSGVHLNALSNEQDGAITFYARHEAPSATGVDIGTTVPAGLIVKINPTLLPQMLGQPATLLHEMTHVTLTGLEYADPQWVTEGVAQYVAEGDNYHDLPGLAGQLRALAAHHTLPTAFDENVDADYVVSQAAVTVLVRMGGPHRLLALIAEYRRTARRTGRAESTNRALRNVYGIDSARLADRAFALLALMNPSWS